MKIFIRTILIYIRLKIFKNRKFVVNLYITPSDENGDPTGPQRLYNTYLIYADSRYDASLKTEKENPTEFREADHIQIDEKIF